LDNHGRCGTSSVADTSRSIFTGLQRVGEGDDDTGARVADSVAKRDSTTIDVDLGGIDVADLLGDTDDNGEGLVQLELGNLVDGKTSLLECERNSLGRCLREVDGVNTSISPRWIESQSFLS
jgi:hypothetical protein